MQPGIETETSRILAAAELWVRADRLTARDAPPGLREGRRPVPARTEQVATAAQAPVPTSAEPPGEPLLVAGWEDGYAACAPHVAGDDLGCHRCPSELVARVLRARGPIDEVCPFGVRLLAFPAPAGSVSSVAVLRIGVPQPGDADLPDLGALRRAARRLRDPAGLATWQAEQRSRGAGRHRIAAATLAQVTASGEAFQHRYDALARNRGHARSDGAGEGDGATLRSLAQEVRREADAAGTRAAHELHDTAAQSMISAHRFLEAAGTSLDQAQADVARGHVQSAQERLLAAIHEVRSVINTLVPPGLEELGPAGALEIYVREHVPGDVTVRLESRLPRLDGWLEGDLFAMTTEAIGNAIRHGRPSTLRIELQALHQRGIISVIDNGTGFDPARVRDEGGKATGLSRITRRAALLGGEVVVSSRPGAGTTIRISVPITGPPGRPDAVAPASGATA